MKALYNTAVGVAAHVSEMQELPIGDTGRTSRTRVVVGTIHGDVEIWIDARELANLYAVRALKSKGRKARVAKGAIEFRAKNVRVERTP